MTIRGTRHNDNLTGSNGDDLFAMDQGGDDTVLGLKGHDIFRFGDTFTAADSIGGGGGADRVALAGDYSGAHAVTFGAQTMTGVENLWLAGGHSYQLTTNDATVAANRVLHVNGKDLGASDTLIFNGSAEKDGSFNIKGGAGIDRLTGGSGSDTFLGGAGADILRGRGGHDVFAYSGGSESNSGAFDHILDFNPTRDAFHAGTVDFLLQVSSNQIQGSLDIDLSLALQGAFTLAGRQPAHFGVSVSFVGNDFAGRTFLVVDSNGNAVYDTGSDLVVEITGNNDFNLHPVTASDFI